MPCLYAVSEERKKELSSLISAQHAAGRAAGATRSKIRLSSWAAARNNIGDRHHDSIMFACNQYGYFSPEHLLALARRDEEEDYARGLAFSYRET